MPFHIEGSNSNGDLFTSTKILGKLAIILLKPDTLFSNNTPMAPFYNKH